MVSLLFIIGWSTCLMLAEGRDGLGLGVGQPPQGARLVPTGVSIAVMGCIVNGPGEMADADFGYVGGAPGKIDLYVGKEVVKRAIPMEGACDALVQLIKVGTGIDGHFCSLLDPQSNFACHPDPVACAAPAWQSSAAP